MNIPGSRVEQDEPAAAKRFGGDRRIARVVFVFIIAAILCGFAENFYLRALHCVAIDSLRSSGIRGASLVPGLWIVLINVATYFAQVAA